MDSGNLSANIGTQHERRNRVVAERLLRPAFCLRAGKRFDADAPILPQAVAA